MVDIVSADALAGGTVAFLAAGLAAGVRWAVSAKARQLDGLPAQVIALQLDHVRHDARLAKLEEAVANDKAGRAAMAAVQTDVAVIRSTVSAIQAEQRDMWSQINKTRPP
jgi:predicted  nucleic acid-binding Zn-ribbon protein